MDYTEFVDTAKDLIAEFGEEATLRKVSQATDPNRPWDVTATDTTTDYPISGVFFPNQGIRNPHTRQLGLAGSDIPSASLTGLLAAKDLPAGVRVDVTDSVVRASGEVWKLHAVDDLNPGGTTVYYEVRLTQ